MDMGVSEQITLAVLIVVLLFVSAFFSGAETALMTVNRIRLRQIARKHSVTVKLIESILGRPEKLIGTILIGNNIVNVAMSAIATAIALSLWGNNGIIYVTAGLTIIILIFAEMMPKVYGRYHSEQLSMISAPVLKVIMTIFNPVVAAATYIVKKLLLLLGIDITKARKSVVTEGEVKTLIHMGWEDGSISGEEKDMLARIFTLNDKSVADVMVPKRRMITLRSDYTINQALSTIKRNGYSRYPVRRGKSQEIIGFIHAKDLLGKKGKQKLSMMHKLIRPPLFILETKKINNQLRHFKSRRQHLAVVLNEQGDVRGLLTLEDILEQMVGSIDDEYDVD